MPEITMAKSDFARLIGVSAARISQMIASGTIGPEALDGNGRGARIKPDTARRQIADRRHPGQALGNGLGTRLDFATPTEAADPALLGGDLDHQYKRERLVRARIANSQLAADQEKRRGRFVPASDVRTELARIAGHMSDSFSEMLPLFADVLASKFSISRDEVLQLLRQEFEVGRKRTRQRQRGPIQGSTEPMDGVE